MIRLVGLAVPHGTSARNSRDTFRVGFRFRAFDTSIRARKVVCCLDHRRDRVLGSQCDASLRLADTTDGLFFTCLVHDDWLAEYLVRAAKWNLLKGVSIGTGVARSKEWGDGVCLMTDIELREISVLTGRAPPAFVGTWVRVIAA